MTWAALPARGMASSNGAMSIVLEPSLCNSPALSSFDIMDDEFKL